VSAAALLTHNIRPEARGGCHDSVALFQRGNTHLTPPGLISPPCSPRSASPEHAPKHLEHRRITLAEVELSDFLTGEDQRSSQFAIGAIEIIGSGTKYEISPISVTASA
jgi:hypothetical protein